MSFTLSMPDRLPRRRRSRVAPLVACLLAAPVFAQTTTPDVSLVLSLSGSRTFGSVVIGPDGDLYGAASVTISSRTGGIIFKVEPDASAVETVYQLGDGDGISPQAGLLLASDGQLYGTTHFGIIDGIGGLGTLFRVRLDGTGFTTLHEFATSTTENQDSSPENEDGAFPDSELIEGSDGLLYGVTLNGGEHGTGTVFRIAKNGTAFETLHEFGEITSDEDSGLTANADGAYPSARLLESNGWLYGTTARGGTNARGVVYRLGLDGTGFAVMHTFTNLTTPQGSTTAVNEDGATPVAELVDGQDGLLYGVTSAGGEKGIGTMFSITPDGTAFTTLHDFDAPNGSQPGAALLLGADGKLYGTTASGGTNSEDETTNGGTVFSVARDGTSFTKLYSFDGEAGAAPNSALVQANGTTFFGTASSGGRCGEGTVFRLSLTGDEIEEGLDSCGNRGDNDGGGSASTLVGLLLLVALTSMSRVIRRRRRSRV